MVTNIDYDLLFMKNFRFKLCMNGIDANVGFTSIGPFGYNEGTDGNISFEDVVISRGVFADLTMEKALLKDFFDQNVGKVLDATIDVENVLGLAQMRIAMTGQVRRYEMDGFDALGNSRENVLEEKIYFRPLTMDIQYVQEEQS